VTNQANSLVGRLYDSDAEDREIQLNPGMAMPKANQLLWVDMDRDEAHLKLVDEALGLTDQLVRLSEPHVRPRLVQAKEFTRLSVIGLQKSTDTPRPIPIDLVAMTNIVVSVHDQEIEGLGMPLDVVRGETQFGALDESAFVAVLLDAILAGYFRAVEGIERKIDEYDTRALQARSDDDLIGDLVGMRREVAVLRRALSPQRELFFSLERPGLVLGDSDVAAWPLLADRFRQALEAVENARELLVGCFDIVISRTGQRTNDVMRVLTVVSSVLLPAVVIAGLMGMNFKVPVFDDPNNFYVVLVATVVLAISILALARWRHWI